MNRKQKAINRKQLSSLVYTLDSNVDQRWREAYKHKIFLVGEERESPYGGKVDFAHFDFMLSHLKWTQPKGFSWAKTCLELLQVFWIQLYPYLKNIITEYERIELGFEDVVADQNLVLKKFADQNLELKIYQQFIKKQSEEMQEEFAEYFKVEKAVIDALIKEAQDEQSKKEMQEVSEG